MTESNFALPEQVDVVVAGGGLAGCCAAIAAAQQGATVLLVEKMADMGGSSLLSGGGIAFAGIAPQKEAGIPDSPALLREDMERIGRGFGDPRLVETYVSAQAGTYEWLRDLGVRFTSLQTGSGNSVPRVLRCVTSQLFEALTATLDSMPPVRRVSGIAVERLLRDGSTVIGVRCRSAAGAVEVKSRAVVLATGGFSRNEDLVKIFAPDMLKAVPVGGDGSTGDGLRMACAAGAGLRDMGFVRATFGSHPDARGAHNLIMHPIYKGAVIINKRGRRFVDESRPYKELGDAVLAQPDSIGYQVFDRTVMEKADPLAVTYDFQGGLAKGLVIEASTLEALAAKIGVDAEALVGSIREYNAAIRDGVADPCGRTTLPGGVARTPIESGPFYAYPSTVVLLSTYCGIAIDESARVLDTFGEPIAGLYAAGELTGGLHGAGYLSGTSLGKSAIFGRLSGINAAQRQAN